MPIDSLYAPEDLIIAQVSHLFKDDLIFVDEDTGEINPKVFSSYHADEDKVGLIVSNSGFQADPLFGGDNNQKLKLLWQVSIICPKELSKTHGALKAIEVMQILKGCRLSPLFDKMQLISDERGFNEPVFEHNMISIPMMFVITTVV